MQTFGSVAAGVDDDFLVTEAYTRCRGVLCGDDHLISDASFCHPFANCSLRLAFLIVVGSLNCKQRSIEREILGDRRINEVPTVLVERVEHSIMIACSHHVGPRVWSTRLTFRLNRRSCLPRLAKIHSPKAKWTDSDGSRWSKQSVVTESCFRERWTCKSHFGLCC